MLCELARSCVPQNAPQVSRKCFTCSSISASRFHGAAAAGHACLEESQGLAATSFLWWDNAARFQDASAGYRQPGGITSFPSFRCCLIASDENEIAVLLAALKACSSSRDLELGKILHDFAARSGNTSNIYVSSSLVSMYAKCGSVVDARGVFDMMFRRNVVSWNALITGYAENRHEADEQFNLANARAAFMKMPQRDVVSWTTLMTGFAEHGEGELAVDLLAEMRREGCEPNAVTYVAALKACSSLAAKEQERRVDGKLVRLESLEKVMAVHAEARGSGCDSDIMVVNTLVDLYAKCGSLVEARRIFDKMETHSVVSWNALIQGHAENGEEEVALEIFARMKRENRMLPNARTFVAALKACSSLAVRERGKQIDAKVPLQVLKTGLILHSEAKSQGCDADHFVASSLVDMYAKCGSMENAREVFESMPIQDVVVRTALMMGYLEDGEAEVSLEIFSRMIEENCPPNARTFVIALKACGSIAVKEAGKQVDGKILKVDSLKRGTDLHVLATRAGCDSDIFLRNTLVDLYAKCGSMENARKVFESTKHHCGVAWNAMIQGYVENGEPELALELFSRCMQRSSVTYVAALKACSSMVDPQTTRAIHAEICRSGHAATSLRDAATLFNSLVDSYSKCGSMVEAQQLFDSVSDRDLVTFNALIAGYCRDGKTNLVFNLFRDLLDEGLHPSGVTFICIITACSHAGLVDAGKRLFRRMSSNYEVEPAIEHYDCMVDLLGRANQLDQAAEMLKSMPFKPNAVTWTTLLAACRKWKNLELGRAAFDALVELNPTDVAAYSLMGSIYGSLGMWEQQAEVETMRLNARAWRKPGRSWWIDRDGRLHCFVAGEPGDHPQSREIDSKLKLLRVKLKEHGYVADIRSVVHNISAEHKEDALCGHSERIAIACALINSAEAETIRITKNLRVCEDCHRVTALISLIEQRTIVCRDANRFHSFKDGKCSCGDFW